MRLRTRVGLLVCALVALATGTSLLAAVGFVLAVFGAAIGLGLIGFVASGGSDDLSLTWALGSMAAGAGLFVLVWAGMVRWELRQGRTRLLFETRDPETETEREAAETVAHLANRDHRVMWPVLAPLVAAEELAESVDDESLDPRDLVWVVLYGAMVWWGTVGVGVFSRGREFAADGAPDG